MSQLILPATLFSLSFVVWIFVVILGKKTIMAATSVVCGVTAAISIIVFLQRQYIALAGTAVCLVFLVAIIYFGLNISFDKKKTDGPLSRFSGCQGISLTCLEPKGDVKINGEKITATTEGLFVPQGAKIKVVRCSNKLVVVEKIVEE